MRDRQLPRAAAGPLAGGTGGRETKAGTLEEPCSSPAGTGLLVEGAAEAALGAISESAAGGGEVETAPIA